MTNLVQLQDDVTQALLSNEALVNVNIINYRKLRLQSEVDLSALWLTPRNGRAGAGIMVEMPTFEVARPNLPGPEGELVIGCACVEEPNLNFEPASGTLLSAEELAQICLDILHGYLIEGAGGLYAEKTAIRPMEEFPGMVAYRASVRMRQPREQTVRVAIPTITEEELHIELACATEAAEIYYTQDGTFPGPSNPGAVKYEEAFDMTGEVLRWAAYKSGLTGSHVGQARNPNSE